MHLDVTRGNESKPDEMEEINGCVYYIKPRMKPKFTYVLKFTHQKPELHTHVYQTKTRQLHQKITRTTFPSMQDKNRQQRYYKRSTKTTDTRE